MHLTWLKNHQILQMYISIFMKLLLYFEKYKQGFFM